MAAAMDLSEWDKDPRLFLFTSLTAGSSHIVTATSRLETILKANKLPFQAIDVATDEKARRLWGRRAGKKKLPGLVKEGYVIGDLEEIEEWNEYGELKENVGPVPANNNASTTPAAPQSTTTTTTAPTAQPGTSDSDPMRDAAAQAASIGLARQGKPTVLVNESKIRPLNSSTAASTSTSTTTTTAATEPSATTSAVEASPIIAPPKAETMTSAPDDKASSIATASAVTESETKDQEAETLNVKSKPETTDSKASVDASESAAKTELPIRSKNANTTTETSEVASKDTVPETIAPETSKVSEEAKPEPETAAPETSKAGEEATVSEPVEDELKTGDVHEAKDEVEPTSKAAETAGAETGERHVKIKGVDDDASAEHGVEARESSKAEEKGEVKDADAAGVSVED